MIDMLSPYELLKRSKPPKPAVYTTAYDHYSAAVHEAAGAMRHEEVPATPLPVLPETTFAPVRTHYISGIKTKHQHALRTARMHPASSDAHASPSFHSP